MLNSLVLAGFVALTAAFDIDAGSRVLLPPRNGFTFATGDIDGPALLNAINRTLLKFQAPHFFPTLFKDSDLGRRQSEQNLTDDSDVDYDAPITVGRTAPQSFTMDFDTGSADIVVPGPLCNRTEGCMFSNTKYNQLGISQHVSTPLVYAGGNLTGDVYVDSVSVGGLTAQNQGLVSLTEASTFAGDNYDGLIGLAFTAASWSNSTTFFENLIAQRVVNTPEFSFYLGREESNTSSSSELTLGGRDTSRFRGAITKIPVINQTAWVVGLDGVSVNDIPAGATTKGQAAIDTGTSFIVAPLFALSAIFAIIPGAFPLSLKQLGGVDSQLYAYPCNTATQFVPSLQFNGTLFPIDPMDFNLGVLTPAFAQTIGNGSLAKEAAVIGGDLCIAALMGINNSVNPNYWAVGDSFLRGWYSIFNYGVNGGTPSVSLAKAN